ncbi:MAG: HD domain-containing protein [Spirochaetales bacterium]|nr:HD domain-containing protein [Spirochaetales bacterium]
MKNHLLAYVFVVFGFVCASLSVIWVIKENKRVHSLTVNAQLGLNEVRSGKDIEIEFEIPLRADGQLNCWKQNRGVWGSQYDVYIYNNSRYTVKNWVLKIKKPAYCHLDSFWNGFFTDYESDDFITVEPSASAVNLTIPSHDKTKIGFVLHTQNLMGIMDFTLAFSYDHTLVKNPGFIFGVLLFILGLLQLFIGLIVDYHLKKQAALADEKINSLVGICARFIDIRDEYTKMHSSHVAEYSMKIAREMGLDEEFQKNIYCLGMLHDTGKVLIPREIICKPGKLTDEEWNEMKNHTIYGGKLLDDFEGLKGLQTVALHHHERYDGKGYPNGLSGREIPLEARIVCVADSFDAMHTNRSYRSRLKDEEIMKELVENKGSQFDPKVADALLSLIKKGEIQ